MGEHDPATTTWLQAFLADHGGVAGTVHRVSPSDDAVLELAAAVNIPPPVQQVTARIPRGKGMAGLALQRGVPVQTCNLRSDTSGDVQPGARAVQASAAVALPVRDRASVIVAVVGIAYPDERELDSEALAVLDAAARTLPPSSGIS
jgi:hypothetical protein